MRKGLDRRINMNIYLLITSLSILLLSVSLLLTKSKKGPEDAVLLIWMSVFALHLITINLLEQELTFLLYVNELLSYTHGAFLYVYTLSFFKQEINWKKLALSFLGVLSYAVVLIYSITVYWENPIIGLISKAVVIVLFVMLTLEFSRNAKANDIAGQLEGKMPWIFFLTAGIIVLLCIPLFHLLIDGESLVKTRNLIGNFAYCIFLVILGFWGIRITPVFVPHRIAQYKASIKPKYGDSSLTPSAKVLFFKDLEELMALAKPFLDPEITIKKVSKILGITSNQLSEIINSEYGNNFNNYINSWRIKEFIEKIENKEHKKNTFLALAFDCGFNSKPSFNRAFNKHIGTSPSEYIKNINQD